MKYKLSDFVKWPEKRPEYITYSGKPITRGDIKLGEVYIANNDAMLWNSCRDNFNRTVEIDEEAIKKVLMPIYLTETDVVKKYARAIAQNMKQIIKEVGG